MHEADVGSSGSSSRCCVLGGVWALWSPQGVSEGISEFLSPLICLCRDKLAAERSHKRGGWQMGSVPITSLNGGKLHITCPDGSPANRAGTENGSCVASAHVSSHGKVYRKGCVLCQSLGCRVLFSPTGLGCKPSSQLCKLWLCKSIHHPSENKGLLNLCFYVKNMG